MGGGGWVFRMRKNYFLRWLDLSRDIGIGGV